MASLNSDTFPSFFSSKSNYASPNNFATIEEAARVIHANVTFNQTNGILLAVPIPKEHSIGIYIKWNLNLPRIPSLYIFFFHKRFSVIFVQGASNELCIFSEARIGTYVFFLLRLGLNCKIAFSN